MRTEPRARGRGHAGVDSRSLCARHSLFGQGSIIEAVGTRLTGKNLPAELIGLAETRPAFPAVGRNNGASGVPPETRR